MRASNITAFLAVALVGLLMSGCTVLRGVVPDVASYKTAVKPPAGFLYTNLKAPQSVRPPADGFGSKTGRATSHQIGLPPLPFPGLWQGVDLIAWGDASKETAARNGGISQVKHSDYKFKMYLGFYRRYTTQAYGD